MVCGSCGSEYEDSLLVCPYCGSENEKRAREEQQEYIEEIKEKIEEVRQQAPREAAKRASHKVVQIAIGVVAAFVVVALGVWLYSGVQARMALQRQMKILDTLEGYYQAQQFEEMSEYIEKNDIRGISFYKYTDVADLYEYAVRRIDSMEYCLEKLSRYDLEPEDVVWEIMDGLDQLQKIYKVEQEDFTYGNESGVLAIKSMYLDTMEEVFLLTAQEIEEEVPAFEYEMEEYLPLAAVAAERMNETYGRVES